MKKIVRFVICCIGAFALVACESKITVTGNNGQTYESYQECCAAQDYEAAHQYLAKIENKKGRQSEWREAKEYIFRQEALYLMGIGDEMAKKRILYLLKEEDDKEDYNNDRTIDDHISMLIDLAIENGDEEMIKMLTNQFKSNDQLTKVISYYAEKGTEESFNQISSLIAKKGLNADDKELLTTLASLNINQFSDAVLGLIYKKEINGRRIPSGIHSQWVLDHDYDDDSRDKQYNSDYYWYFYDVRDYNRLCSLIMDVAINSKNNYIASKVLSLFREDVYKILGGKDVKAPNGTRIKEEHYYVYYSNDSKNEARRKYLEAKNAGVFK